MPLDAPLGSAERKEKVAFSSKSIDRENRTIDFVLSDETVDRDGDIIRAAGWDLRNFSGNAPLLAFHDAKLPVGSWRNVRVEGAQLVGTAVFAAAGQVPLADQLFALYADGHLSAVSVGFSILEAGPRVGDDGKTYGLEIKRAELLECSLVTIPANPNARRRAVKALHKAAEGASDADVAAAARIIKQLEKAEPGDSFTTADEEGHSHAFEIGETQTETAGDPPHAHALTYDDTGALTGVESSEDHSHELPAEATTPPEIDDEEDGAGEAGNTEEDEKTAALDLARRALDGLGKQFQDHPEALAQLGDALVGLERSLAGDPAPVAEMKGPADAFGDAELADVQRHWPEIAELAGEEMTATTLARALLSQAKDQIAEKRLALTGKTYEIVRDAKPVEQDPAPFDAAAFSDALAEKLGTVVPNTVAKCLRQPAGRV